MACCVLPPRLILGSLGLLGLLAGCSPYQREERPPWRSQAEQACLARTHVEENASIRSAQPIEGPGICGLTHPFKVTALAGGTVMLNSTATLDCSMIETLDTWIRQVVQPAAQARFGESVVRINSMGSYSCRGINNMSGANLSEHSFGNAIDIGGFVLASGRELNIMRGFNGSDDQERAFLHEAHAGACSYFTTVLGPGYNIFHYNHFHVDLAMHGATSRGPRRYCKPIPAQALPEAPRHDTLPDPPPIEEEMDIARAPIPAPELGASGPSFVATAPLPAVQARRPTLSAYSPSAPRPDVASLAPLRGDARSRHSAAAVAPPPIVTFSNGGAEPADSAALDQAPDPIPPVPVRSVRRAALPRVTDDSGGAPEADPERAGDAAPAYAAPAEAPDGAPPADIGPPADAAPVSNRAIPSEAPSEGAPNNWDLAPPVRH